MRDSKLYSLMLQKIGPVSRVLDVGCGEGKFALLLARKTKKKIVGLDISELGFYKAKKEASKEGVGHLITCIKCNVYHIEKCVRSDRFEAVTMTYTLHHLKKPTAALSEIRKILSLKGRILIVECVLDGVEEKGRCNKFTILGIQRMLKKAKYRLLTMEELENGLALFEAENLAAEDMRA